MTLDGRTIQAAVDAAHHDNAGLQGGENASYIPFLASVDPTLFGVAVVTAEGDVHSAGDADARFAIESISKVFTMARAMADVGAEAFHEKIGADPTGLPLQPNQLFSALTSRPVTRRCANHENGLYSVVTVTVVRSLSAWPSIVDHSSGGAVPNPRCPAVFVRGVPHTSSSTME